MLRRNTLILAAVLAFTAPAASGCGLNTNPGSGEKIGQVVKLNREGIFSKTWEAQLIRGGLSGGSGSFGTTPFDFTIEDAATAEQVQQYLTNGTELIITYRIEGVYAYSRSSSGGHFLTSVRPASDSIRR